MTRSELREKVMIVLYQVHLYQSKNIEFNLENIIKDNIENGNKFSDDLITNVLDKTPELDKIANEYMNEWSIDRIDKTGAEIMRIALYELTYTDTPKIVAIDEAVELAKKYSDDSVRKIINATLDKYIRK